MIKVAVAGALGRVGQEVVQAVQAEDDLRLVAAVDVRAGTSQAPNPEGYLLNADLTAAIRETQPQVLVDFTVAEAAAENALTALRQGVRPVIGTTGMSEQQLAEIERVSREQRVGAFLAPNFAIGGVLMMYFARVAARYFDSAEIIELHHDQKVDAPSGTALKTAQEMAEAHGKAFASNVPTREPLPGGRGANWQGVRVHSVRLPGLVAHQEVLLGGQGQTLTIRHDTSDRSAFMPGVLLAVREVLKLDRLVIGLDNLLRLV